MFSYSIRLWYGLQHLWCAYVIILMCVYTRTHGGWAHRQWVSTTFFTCKSSQFFLVRLMGFKLMSLMSWNLDSDVLPIEPPHHPNCCSSSSVGHSNESKSSCRLLSLFSLCFLTLIVTDSQNIACVSSVDTMIETVCQPHSCKVYTFHLVFILLFSAFRILKVKVFFCQTHRVMTLLWVKLN